jgi:hypothetical protein
MSDFAAGALPAALFPELGLFGCLFARGSGFAGCAPGRSCFVGDAAVIADEEIARTFAERLVLGLLPSKLVKLGAADPVVLTEFVDRGSGGLARRRVL